MPVPAAQSKVATSQYGVVRTEILRRDEFESWNLLVDRSPHGTVFHYSWWLEAAGFDFEILVCRDEQGEMIAGIPLPRRKWAGVTLFHLPLLTPYMGPVFDLSRVPGMHQHLSIMREVGETLARAIRGYDSLRYNVGASGPDLQGFLWAGFRAELYYTYRFEAGMALEEVVPRLAQHHRRNLTKAQREQTPQDVENKIDVLMDLTKESFARQGLPLPYPEQTPRRLWAAALSRGRANIYVSGLKGGIPVAALLVVHDRRTCYQLLAGTKSDARNLGGGFLVEWAAIRDALESGRAFDFEGSNMRGVELYYRRWGGLATPLWRLERAGTFRGAVVRTLRKMSAREWYGAA